NLVVRSGAPTITGTVTPPPNTTVDGTLPACGECGNNVIDPGEVCDDGNNIDCDGCSADCKRHDNICGDGIKECGHQSHGGTLTPGDGCEPDCTPTVTANARVRIAGTPHAVAGCFAEWDMALANPSISTTTGLPNVIQTCIDSDPACDTDGANNLSCSFDMR